MDILDKIIEKEKDRKSLDEPTYCPKCEKKMEGEIVKRNNSGRLMGFLECKDCGIKIMI